MKTIQKLNCDYNLSKAFGYTYYVTDHLGNTLATYTSEELYSSIPESGEWYAKITYQAEYFPYGKIIREYVNGNQERYLTTQHERDKETGLEYSGARYCVRDRSVMPGT